MGNPAHLEELLKGVEHWNRWRGEQGPDFRPNLSGLDILESISEHLAQDEPRRTVDERFEPSRETRALAERKWAGSGLEPSWTNRRVADDGPEKVSTGAYPALVGIDFKGTDLSQANLSRIDLSHSDFRGALLLGTSLEDSSLAGSNVRTDIVSTTHSGDGAVIRVCDLGKSVGLTQEQLDTMDGDSGTLVPDGLTRPAHWPEFEETVLAPTRESSDEPLLAPLAPVTPAIEVRWEGEHLHAELRLTARDPDPRRFHAPVPAATTIDLLTSLGQIARQISRSLKVNATDNTSRICGDAAPLFEAIAEEVAKPEGLVLSFVIEFNLMVIGQLADSEDFPALSHVDRTSVQEFLRLGQEWRRRSGLIQEIEDPHNAEIVPEGRIEEIEEKVQNLIDVITDPEGERYLSPTLPGVTREMSIYRWDTDDGKNRRARLAAFGALAAQFYRALKNPPEGVRTTVGFYATLLAAAAGVIALFV